MADEKSCGDKYIASKEAYFIRNKIVERDLEHCRSLTPIQVDTILELSKEYKDDDNPLSLKVNVDASDALTGLKAIQREAKKATAALKELEEQQKKKGEKDSVRPCPKCKCRSVETSKLYADGKGEPIQIINECMDCGWTYNE